MEFYGAVKKKKKRAKKYGYKSNIMPNTFSIIKIESNGSAKVQSKAK